MTIPTRYVAVLCLGTIVALYSDLSALRGLAGQQSVPAPVVRAIAAAKRPLPPEEKSAGVTRFSYIVYGDTRGRRDGVELQYEHSLVADSIVSTIKRLDTTEYPVRLVMQTGDAVLDGGDARQWNSSFVDVINRITIDGG